jgi:hypothetical protein
MRKSLALILLLVLLVSSFFNLQATTGSSHSFGITNAATTRFQFNNTGALEFFLSLSTSTGLLTTYPQSGWIYLSDDQQLDYSALTKLGNNNALLLAGQIKSAMSKEGGLYGGFNPSTCTYGLWNGVDVLIGKYMPIPCNGVFWNDSSGNDVNYPSIAGIKVNATKWGLNSGTFTNYADLELYYSLDMLHYRQYKEAVSAFEVANSYWNGQGFADSAYTHDPSAGYASFKLAIDLIVFRALLANKNTKIPSTYQTIMGNITKIMSSLQKSGGVITSYTISNGGVKPLSGANGETTALFVLAE